MRIKTLIYNCKDRFPFLRRQDMDVLPFQGQSDLDADDAITNQELCRMQDEVVEDILRSAEDDSDTVVVVAAREPEVQDTPVKDALRNMDFDRDRFELADPPDATREGMLGRLRERIEKLVHLERKRD